MKLTAPTDAALAAEYRRQGWWRTSPLRDGLERIADVDGDRVAVVDNDGTWTYGQLRARVEAAVATFSAAGVTAGDAVVIIAPNSLDAVAAILGAIRANGVAVVLDRRCGARDVANAVSSSGARHIAVPDRLRSSLVVDDHGAAIVDLEQVGSGGQETGWSEPDPAQPRFVVFTSGTTRRSKGVVHTLETMAAGLRNLAIVMSFTEEDRAFLSSPIGTITGLSQVLMATTGGSIVLEDRFDATVSLDRIEQHGATVIGGAPVILEMLFDEYARRGLQRSSLRQISLGGTMIPRSVLEIAIDRFGIRPTRVYGSSEVPVHTASTEGDSFEERLSDDGKPLPGSECRMGDEFEGGHELQVRGPNLFQGYLFEEDNEGVFNDGWFRTGDLVEERDGRIRVLGRLQDVVARKGLKVSLAEVDDAAATIRDAFEVAAYGVADGVTGERVALAVHLPDDRSIDYDEVVAVLSARGLARGKLPEEIVVWHEPIPRNPSGKVLRAALSQQAGGRPRSVAPRLRGPDPAPTD